jgi:acetolactate synthase-1/2/3 large subunit
MKTTDYIVEYLINKGVTDVFGYPGGMVTHLMESFRTRETDIKAHVCYHEQAAAFEACGYAQTSGKIGVAFATSGPGATNLITGICNAYFDSIPVIFITGQVNTFESKNGLNVRQRGFQETNIVEMVKSVTKFSKYITSQKDLVESLDAAYNIAMSGRKGPVLLDIPMNIQRSDLKDELNFSSKEYCVQKNDEESISKKTNEIISLLYKAKRPVIILGSGIKQSNCRTEALEFCQTTGFPVVTSMTAIDLVADSNNYYGFIGAYGNRTANFIVAKSDLIISFGARLDIRQVGGVRDTFAPNAKIIRVDIDEGEIEYQIRSDELDVIADVCVMLKNLCKSGLPKVDQKWINICNKIQTKLDGIDDLLPNKMVKNLSKYIPDNFVLTTDVGQNQVWIAQSFCVKKKQSILFSGGHGAMGYSLPAAIGAYYGTKRPVISFNGDGGIQMNIQELEFINREKLPITIVVFNNNALGMIRHFQEMYFECHYTETVSGNGYAVPSFEKIAYAYDLEYCKISKIEDIRIGLSNINFEKPRIIEVCIDENTYVYPKLRYGEPNQDQEPLISRDLYEELMGL